MSVRPGDPDYATERRRSLVDEDQAERARQENLCEYAHEDECDAVAEYVVHWLGEAHALACGDSEHLLQTIEEGLNVIDQRGGLLDEAYVRVYRAGA